jgi:hypothetical protein
MGLRQVIGEAHGGSSSVLSNPIIPSTTINASLPPYNADPLGIVESSAAINAAMTDTLAGGGLYLPRGIYKLSSPIIYKVGRHFLGDAGPGGNSWGTKLIQTGTGPVIQFDTAATSHFRGGEIGRMTLIGNYADTVTGDGISNIGINKELNYNFFHDLEITNCGRDGFHLQGDSYWVEWNNFDRVYVHDTYANAQYNEGARRYGFYAEGGFSTNTFNGCRFVRCGCLAGGGGIYLTDASSIYPENTVFINLSCEGNGGDAAHNNYDVQVWGAQFINCQVTTIVGGYFEGNGTGDSTKLSGGLNFSGSHASGNNIIGALFSAEYQHIAISDGYSYQIIGNQFMKGTLASPTGCLIVSGGHDIYLGPNRNLNASTLPYIIDTSGLNEIYGDIGYANGVIQKMFSVPALQVGSSAIAFLAGTADPTSGLAAPIGSLYQRNNSGTAEQWAKTGAGDTQWTKKW